MNMTILTPEIIRHRLKAATRDLVRQCGGIERCAELTGYSDTQASRWQSVGETATIPLQAVVILEADCGVPTVSSALAALNGRRLADPEEAAPEMRSSVLGHFASIARKSSDLQAAMADAMSDYRLTPAEAEVLTRAAGEMIATGHRVQQDMATVKARGGVDLRDRELVP